MKIYEIPSDKEFPFQKDPAEDTSSWLERDIFPKDKVEAIWYWYESGSWEGSGDMLVRTKDGLFHHFSLSHCSCYGPLDGIEDYKWNQGQRLDDFKNWFSEEYYNDIKNLIEAARA